MVEPVTTVGLGAVAAYLSKDGVSKLLGPTAEYLGNGLRDFTQKRVENVGRIFKKAETKLGNKIESEGQVPPKVLKSVVNEGSYCDEELAAEYFGGVLASSRTSVTRDDRGARVLKIVDGLSSYQIRTHFLVYSAIRKNFLGKEYVFNQKDRPKMELIIPFASYIAAMEFNQIEQNQLLQILNHSFFGLHNEGLIDNFSYGPEEEMKKRCPTADTGGIVCSPSALGAELFLWAHGLAENSSDYILKAPKFPEFENDVSPLEGCMKTKE